jgi:CBS-domain-containing membrane protein
MKGHKEYCFRAHEISHIFWSHGFHVFAGGCIGGCIGGSASTFVLMTDMRVAALILPISTSID